MRRYGKPIWASPTRSAVNWGDVYGRIDWSWTDDYNTSFSADPRLIQNPYSWINLRAGSAVEEL